MGAKKMNIFHGFEALALAGFIGVTILALLPVGTVVTRPRCPRLGSLAVRTFRLVTLATVAIAVAACAIQPTELSPVEVCATRATVESVLG